MLTEQEREWVTGVCCGTVVRGGLPDGVLAELDLEHRAEPKSVTQARHLFEEAQLSDFEAIGTRGRKWLHKATGRQFIIDESQILMSPNPSRLGIEYFCVHAGRLLFMRARDFDPVDRGAPGVIVSGVVRQSVSDGRIRVVDARTGAPVQDGVAT